jgi:hypothetical protein
MRGGRDLMQRPPARYLCPGWQTIAKRRQISTFFVGIVEILTIVEPCLRI